MSKHKDIINSYKEANVSSTELYITLKQLIEFILDLLLRQYVFLNMLPLLLFIYLM